MGDVKFLKAETFKRYHAFLLTLLLFLICNKNKSQIMAVPPAWKEKTHGAEYQQPNAQLLTCKQEEELFAVVARETGVVVITAKPTKTLLFH